MLALKGRLIGNSIRNADGLGWGGLWKNRALFFLNICALCENWFYLFFGFWTWMGISPLGLIEFAAKSFNLGKMNFFLLWN